ncbi:MAG: class I SAM-dependent methyltransferase [Bacteroidetes bacterium]|nr:MAG: class I SAM-dependent methyltransferase [Bacteroidota bacterium]
MTIRDHMITKEEFKLSECASCGFVFTNPRPSRERIGEYYKSEDYISHSSTKKGLINFLYNKVRNYTLGQKLRLLRKYGQGNLLLDIGAGSGHFSNHCVKSGMQVLSLEPDEDARSFARKEFGLEMKEMPELYRLKNGEHDMITMWHVLEHVYDLQKDFGQFARVLKAGGTFFIAVPNRMSYDAKLYQSDWAAYDVPRHLYHFRETDIRRLAEQYGFVLERTVPMKFDAYYVSMLSEKYRNGSMLKAVWNAWRSNVKSSDGGYSSQIYILKKL